MENPNETVARLIDQWCARRALGPLRYALQGWPPHNALTDGVADLLDALEKTRAFAREALTAEEGSALDGAISQLQGALRNR